MKRKGLIICSAAAIGAIAAGILGVILLLKKMNKELEELNFALSDEDISELSFYELERE